MKIDTRSFTNVILSVIATLLLLLLLQGPNNLSPISDAQAGREKDIPELVSTDPLTAAAIQELAKQTGMVAMALSKLDNSKEVRELAASNRDIAKKTGAIASAIDKVASTMSINNN